MIAPSLLPDNLGAAASAQSALAHTLLCSCLALPFTLQYLAYIMGSHLGLLGSMLYS